MRFVNLKELPEGLTKLPSLERIVFVKGIHQKDQTYIPESVQKFLESLANLNKKRDKSDMEKVKCEPASKEETKYSNESDCISI